MTHSVANLSSGYVFPNAQSIDPFLEYPGTGPTSRFCAQLAERLRCYVAAGYPERLASHELENEFHNDSRIGANSAVLYGPTGELIDNYRKTNLFETDITWAKPGIGPLSHYSACRAQKQRCLKALGLGHLVFPSHFRRFPWESVWI